MRGCLTATRNAAGCETLAGNNSVLRKKLCTGARTHEGSKEMISAESGFQDFGINPTLAGLHLVKAPAPQQGLGRAPSWAGVHMMRPAFWGFIRLLK